MKQKAVILTQINISGLKIRFFKKLINEKEITTSGI
jgi:hypothetical protein